MHSEQYKLRKRGSFSPESGKRGAFGSVIHRGIRTDNGNVSIAHADFQILSIVGQEVEGSLVTVAAPDNGDDLAAVGVVARAAG